MILILTCVMKYSSITFHGVRYSSCLLKSSHHYIAMAEWNVDVFGMPLSQLPGPHHPKEHIRPVQIDYFVRVAFSNNETQVFAAVSWFAPHPRRYMFGQPVQVWCKSLFELGGKHSFLPLQYLVSQCAYSFKTVDKLNECVLIVVGIV